MPTFLIHISSISLTRIFPFYRSYLKEANVGEVKWDRGRGQRSAMVGEPVPNSATAPHWLLGEIVGRPYNILPAHYRRASLFLISQIKDRICICEKFVNLSCCSTCRWGTLPGPTLSTFHKMFIVKVEGVGAVVQFETMWSIRNHLSH